jgi:hypothetical protein
MRDESAFMETQSPNISCFKHQTNGTELFGGRCGKFNLHLIHYYQDLNKAIEERKDIFDVEKGGAPVMENTIFNVNCSLPFTDFYTLFKVNKGQILLNCRIQCQLGAI